MFPFYDKTGWFSQPPITPPPSVFAITVLLMETSFYYAESEITCTRYELPELLENVITPLDEVTVMLESVLIGQALAFVDDARNIMYINPFEPYCPQTMDSVVTGVTDTGLLVVRY